MKIVRSLLVLAVGMVLATGEGRAATWQGDLLNVQFLSPNPQTVVFNGNFTVPASGIDFTGEGILLLNIEASLVSLVNTTNATIGLQAPSAIVKITDTTASNIENVQVDSGSTIDLGQGQLISGNNFLQFELADAFIPPNGVLNLQVSFLPGTPAPIPAPGPLPVFASALVGLISARWIASRRGRGRNIRAAFGTTYRYTMASLRASAASTNVTWKQY
jgi:hypothetical protein